MRETQAREDLMHAMEAAGMGASGFTITGRAAVLGPLIPRIESALAASPDISDAQRTQYRNLVHYLYEYLVAMEEARELRVRRNEELAEDE